MALFLRTTWAKSDMLRRSNIVVTGCEENPICLLRREDCGGCSIRIKMLEGGGEVFIEEVEDNNEEEQQHYCTVQ